MIPSGRSDTIAADQSLFRCKVADFPSLKAGD
jgi:hypothetical protein